MIKADRLTKTFEDKKRGKITAVDNASFEVNPGEIFGLLGLNGAGKTTTLRILAGILKPVSGTAIIDGIDVVKQPEKAKARLGFMTGSTGLYGRLKAIEMIRYFGRLYGMSESETTRRTELLIDLLGLKEYADIKCDKLSSGNKQKVSIARTMIHDPQVIILDEPTAGLDVIASRALVEFINAEKDRNKTIIFSTHVMHEAEKLCDRIGIIHKGRIIAVGTPSLLNSQAGCSDLDDTFVKLVG
jgi:sodium transport system ATP-binding protein